jgi:hypothetical protein
MDMRISSSGLKKVGNGPTSQKPSILNIGTKMMKINMF